MTRMDDNEKYSELPSRPWILSAVSVKSGSLLCLLCLSAVREGEGHDLNSWLSNIKEYE